jgi:hypothetical protein
VLTLGDVVVGQTAIGYSVESQWSPTPDSVQYQWYFNDVAIADATANGYEVPFADQGGHLKLAITAVKAGYASSTVTSPDTLVLGELDTGTPTLSAGPYRVGVPITVDPGTWAPADTVITYSWSLGFGQVSDTDSVTPEDNDVDGLTVTVYGYHDGYAGGAVSLNTGPIAPDRILHGTPTISGGSTTYSVLTVDPKLATWNPASTSLTYQWNRDGEPITKATSTNYIVEPADVSHRISVTVTGSADGYTPVSVTSAAEEITAGKLKLPRTTITGTPGIGHALKAHVGPVEAPGGFVYRFDWFLDGVPAPDSTAGGSYYPDSSADVGKQVTVAARVYYRNYPAQESEQSAPSAPIADGTPAPGSAIVSAEVGAAAGVVYEGPRGVTSPREVWFLDGVELPATPTFYPTAADWHHKLSASVIVTTSDNVVVTTMSAPGLITTGYFAGTPTISGDGAVRGILTVNEAWVRPTPTTTRIVWYEGSGLTHSHKEIGTGASLRVPSGAAGKQIFAVTYLSALHVHSSKTQTAPITISTVTDTRPNPWGLPHFQRIFE